MKIAWSVKLPQDAKMKVKDGQAVVEGDLIYEYHQNIVNRVPVVGWQTMGANDRKAVLNHILNKEVTKDEIIGKSGWLSPTILKSPGEGKCVGIDEFGNIELQTEKEESYVAPVSAKKIRVEKEKVIFELNGSEFETDGINQLKAWGDFEERIFSDLDQISSHQVNKVIIVEGNLETAIKAEAIGVAGLILVDVEKFREFEDSDIPVVQMTREQADKLIKFGEKKKAKAWVNATASKVLLVLE